MGERDLSGKHIFLSSGLLSVEEILSLVSTRSLAGGFVVPLRIGEPDLSGEHILLSLELLSMEQIIFLCLTERSAGDIVFPLRIGERDLQFLVGEHILRSSGLRGHRQVFSVRRTRLF